MSRVKSLYNMENQESKTMDTYGSKLRNLLSPFYNVIAAIDSNENQDYMSISDDELIKFLRYSCDDLWEAYKRMLELSYDEHLNEREYVDK